MKMISLDDIIKYCDSERAAYKANNCGNACTALRRLAEFAKEYAIETEPVKHGRWIPQGYNMWLCSNCKKNIIYSEHESDRAEKQRYCCRCGARMSEV